MVRQKGSPKRKRLSEEQVQEIMRMRRQGESIKAIAQVIGCHRQTVRLHLKERQADVLAEEVRKQTLTDELQKHLDDLTQFAASLVGHLTIPDSATEDRDVVAVLDPLLPKDLPQGLDSASRKVRREQRQTDRQNKMLLMSLREHTRDRGWWAAYEEWQEVWNTCRNAVQELRGEADEVVENHINEKPSLKGEVERRIKEGRDTVGRIISDLLSVVWRASTGKPVEKFEYRAEEGRVVAYFADGMYHTIGHRLSEDSLGPDMTEVSQFAFETLCQSFSNKSIAEMLHRMDEKIEVIDDALDPFVLRPLLVRTRCDLCPV